MGRRSVWSDPRIQELARQFVPAADEVWRLQRDDDPECRFFRRAVRGTEEMSRGTLQGIYVFSPGGVLLARRNSLSADKIAELLEAALDRWRTMKPEALDTVAPVQPRHRWEDCLPEGGLVLVRYARDLGADFDPHAPPRPPANRDQIWFSAQEARHWLPASIEPGAEHTLPDGLFRRLACLHLVDNVRGQTLPYAPEEVGGALHTEVLRVRDGAATLRIEGSTTAMAKGPWLLGDNDWKPKRQPPPHGLRTEIVGMARYDIAAGRFTRFDLVAVGWRWGRAGVNGRGREKTVEPRPIGFSCSLPTSDLRIAPTFIDVYNADWVRPPRGH